MTSLEVARIAAELQSLLERRLSRVFALERGRFALKFSGLEQQLFIDPRGAVFLAAEPPGERREPDRFLKLLRATLENRRLESVRQVGFDRVLRFGLGGPTLVVELFAGGNLILLEADDRIAEAFRRLRLKNRSILKGVVYAPPPGTDPRELAPVEFAVRLRASKSDLVRTLAAPLGLGSDVAEEACARAGLDPGSAARELAEEDSASLFDRAMEIVRTGAVPGPAFLAGEGSDETRVFRQEEGGPAEELPDLSSALSRVYGEGFEAPERDETREDEAARIRESQLRAAAELRMRAESLQQDAGAVLQAFQAVQGALETARRTKGKELPPGARAAERPKRFEMEIGGRKVALDWSLDARGNANRIYAEAKTLREKGEGAARAAKSTVRIAGEGRDPEPAPGGARKRRAPRWYEKFRHTFTSGGLLAVAGRSAQENERVVKRHLGEQDIYIHAEVHGAASVVLRNGSTAEEAQIREAGAFAVCYSKLWAAGAAAGDAFWVRADQVSKSPPSGEFVARGSFFISGRKNILKDMPLKLVIKMREADGEEMLLAFPLSGPGGGDAGIIIAPGDREAADVAKEISRSLGVKVESVQRLMPPGRSRILGR
jgi:predicted ribosome quality control (RQC) complex YloA/Tae2 family protein